MADGFQVVIAGGGVAALEAVLALRARAPAPVAIELISPSRDFRLEALSVAEPFGGDAKTLDLADFCDEHGVDYRAEGLAEVWGGPQRVLTDHGEEVFYDALLMATGARRASALPGSHPFRGAADVAWFGNLLERLRRGAITDVVFAVPPKVRWTLPIWELAMLTSTWLADAGTPERAITVVTHEQAPLEVLGDDVSARVRELLGERGVGLETGTRVIRFDQGRLVCEGGRELGADEVVALPGLSVPEFPGVPQGRDGFIGCDAEMRVDGVDHAWAVGDSTWFPIKQGGVAAQQAEVAVVSILRSAGVDIEPVPFRPVLRGALITGREPQFIRASVGDEQDAVLTRSPLWWPPIKVAGPRLGPYLARRWSLEEDHTGPESTEDLKPAEDEREHEAALRLALDFADIDARDGDYDEALRWLEVAERLNVTLPAEYVQRRDDWRAAA